MPGLSGSILDPNVMNLNPSANALGTSTGSLGSLQNPLAPTTATGTAQPSITSPSAAPAPYVPTGSTAALAGLNPAQLSGLLGGGAGTGAYGPSGYPTGTIGGASFGDIGTGFATAGYKYGIANALTQFLFSGAGYNPDAAAAQLAALQPQIEAGRANLMEQFGSHGLAMGSPAALGLSNYYANTNLAVGKLLSDMYMDSVKNYMTVLLSGKGPEQKYGTGEGGGILGSIGQLLGGISGGGLF